MWFTLGFLTLIISSLYFGVKRYKSNWKGMPAMVAGLPCSTLMLTHKKKTTSILIGCASGSDIDLSIKMEKWWDRLFKWLGLINEYQIGKEYLDKELYVMSDNSVVSSVIGRSAQIQQALSEIIVICHNQKMKLKALHVRNKRIWIQLIPDNKADLVTPLSLAYLFVPLLKKITETYHDELPSGVNSYRDPAMIKTFIILAISTGMAITGFANIFLSPFTVLPFVVDKLELFIYSLYVGTVVVAILVISAVYYLNKTSRLHLVLLELLTVGYFGSVSCSYAFIENLNQELDIGPSQEIIVSVQRTYISHSRKRGDSYYFYINDWTKPGTLKIKVRRDIYSQYHSGDKVRIVESNGYFGFLWVSAIDVDKNRNE